MKSRRVNQSLVVKMGKLEMQRAVLAAKGVLAQSNVSVFVPVFAEQNVGVFDPVYAEDICGNTAKFLKIWELS